MPYDVLDATGSKVAAGTTDAADVELPEGVYTVVLRAETPIEIPHVRITPRERTTVELKKEGREVAAQVSPQKRAGGF